MARQSSASRRMTWRARKEAELAAVPLALALALVLTLALALTLTLTLTLSPNPNPNQVLGVSFLLVNALLLGGGWGARSDAPLL